jgi:hypothetical protein
MRTPSDAEEPAVGQPSVHHWARTTFFVAFFVMVWPLEGDALFAELHHGRWTSAAAFAALCFFGVLSLFILSCVRLRIQPPGRRSIAYLIATGAIMLFNVWSVYEAFRYADHPNI